MTKRGRRTSVLRRLAQSRFYGCEVCSKNDAFTPLEDVLERCRFSQREIRRLDGDISCPGCESYLNLSDNVADYSEGDLKRIRRLDRGFRAYLPQLQALNEFMQQFPTLALSHPVGQRLFREVTAGMAETLPPKTWLRGAGQKTMTADRFLPNLAEPQRPYRFNHSGQPALYLAAEAETAVVEALQERKANTAKLWIAQIAIEKELRVLNINAAKTSSLFLEVLLLSSLLRTPRKKPGHFQPQYLLTRLLADIARRKGFDGILYPSLEYPYTYEVRGTNLVLLNPAYSDFVKLGPFQRHIWKQISECPPFDLPQMRLEVKRKKGK
jgi:RES domain-containing protein